MDLWAGCSGVQVLHAHTREFVHALEPPSRDILKPLQEARSIEASQILRNHRHWNTDFRYLVSIWQLTIREPVVAHYEQRAWKAVGRP
jgi:hypothetical protein